MAGTLYDFHGVLKYNNELIKSSVLDKEMQFQMSFSESASDLQL
jgi:hypothetical protein